MFLLLGFFFVVGLRKEVMIFFPQMMSFVHNVALTWDRGQRGRDRSSMEGDVNGLVRSHKK